MRLLSPVKKKLLGLLPRTEISREETERLLPFTAHRVKLTNNIWSIPEGGDDPFSGVRIDTMRLWAGGGLKGKRVLDLGCLEGGYCAAFARMGAVKVVGVDVRPKNLERAKLVKRCLKLGNVDLRQVDVRQVNRKNVGEFEIVFAAGILYHLDDPYIFLRSAAEMTLDFLFLDTHIAWPGNQAHGASGGIIEKTFGEKSYQGQEMAEYPEETTQDSYENMLWASYGNSKSFWLTEDSLVEMLKDVGFSFISKVYVPRGYRCLENCQEECRVILVAKKSLS